jgi:hypothetical protein
MSEFGKGFTYCIGLFLAHAERYGKLDDDMRGAELWFNGASDHLFEIEIPDNFILKEECQHWAKLCCELRLNYEATKVDKDEAIKKAKNFLLEWDKQCGISCEKGDWE